MQDLGTLGGTDSSAYGINASGQIVGYAGTDSFAATTHPFLYANGVMTDLGALGDNCHTRATGINASGQIVGYFIKECHVMSATGAFLYSDGKMVDLNSLLPANSGWTQLAANAINDYSQMVGYGTIDGQTHAFLMSDSAITLIVHYYTSILGRTPDAGGLAFWKNQITQAQASGQDVKPIFREMAVQFFNSPEYLANNTSNTEFITNLYRTFFQRDPDSAGMAFWLNQLALGVTRDVVMGGFLYSNEFTTFMQSLGF